jgi:predicted DNA-binding transcriptional regulator AlpA
VRLSERRLGWVLCDVIAWIEERRGKRAA